MKLDPVDIMILKELSQDGRASLRQIASRSFLSTPTVSSRFERMRRGGLIQKFVPLINLEASENSGLLALVTLIAPSSSLSKAARYLSKRPEVYSVYLTTGTNNLMVKLSVPNAQSLQRFLESSYIKKLGIQVISSQVVTQTIKDEHPLPFAGEFKMKLSCDLCKGDITSSRPYTIKVASTRYYFCCKTCKANYLEEYRERIKKINQAI